MLGCMLGRTAALGGLDAASVEEAVAAARLRRADARDALREDLRALAAGGAGTKMRFL